MYLDASEPCHPPCEDCYVVLLSVNEYVIYLYGKLRKQIILSGMGDIININQNAIRNLLELYEVKNKRKMFDDIIECFNIEQELSKELTL